MYHGIKRADLIRTCAEDIVNVIDLFYKEHQKPVGVERDECFNAPGAFKIIEERVHLLQRFVKEHLLDVEPRKPSGVPEDFRWDFNQSRWVKPS
jgi:hypothetical protein